MDSRGITGEARRSANQMRHQIREEDVQIQYGLQVWHRLELVLQRKSSRRKSSIEQVSG